MDGLMSKLRKLDAYPKVNEDFYSRTLPGGVITLASSIVMFLLFFSSSSSPSSIEKALQRHGGRLEHNETCCGSCYGAETSAEDCCNSCEEVLEAYRKKGWAMTDPEFNGPICKNKLAKERDFSEGLKMKKVRGAAFMGSWKLIRWLEIYIFLGRVFSNLVFMYMICWHFRRIVLMF